MHIGKQDEPLSNERSWSICKAFTALTRGLTELSLVQTERKGEGGPTSTFNPTFLPSIHFPILGVKHMADTVCRTHGPR